MPLLRQLFFRRIVHPSLGIREQAPHLALSSEEGGLSLPTVASRMGRGGGQTLNPSGHCVGQFWFV